MCMQFEGLHFEHIFMVNSGVLCSSSDVDREEHLIVTAPVWDQDILNSHTMGQDEPAVPMGGPLKVNIQTLEAEQTENLPEDLGSVPVPASSPVKETFEVSESTAASCEPSQAPVPVLLADPVLEQAPTPVPAPVLAPVLASIPEPESVQDIETEVSPALELPEQKPVAEPEPQYNGLDQTEPPQKTKTGKSKPPSLMVKATLDDPVQTNEEQALPVPKATYKFDPDQLDDSFNPFISGGSKIPNSPPPCGSSSLPRLEPLGASLPVYEANSAPAAEEETMESLSKAKPVVLEFGLDEGTVSKPPPRKLGGKKTISKLAAKKQKPKGSAASSKPASEPTDSQPVLEPLSQPVSEPDSQPVSEPDSQPAPEPVSDPLLETALPGSDSTAPLNLDDVPIPKTGTYNFDPNQWDDPNFNPFGSNNKMSGSPVLPKGSYSFDPDNFDDSVDPFKPSKALSTEESSSSAPQLEKKVKEVGKQKGGQPAGEKKVRQIPKKSKERSAE